MTKYLNRSAGMLVMPVNDGREVKPGGEIDLDEKAQKIPAVAAWIKDGALAKAGKSEGQGKAPQSAYTVSDKGNGWFVVKHGEQEATKSLRAEDVSGFEDFSEDDKAAFVQANAAE